MQAVTSDISGHPTVQAFYVVKITDQKSERAFTTTGAFDSFLFMVSANSSEPVDSFPGQISP